MKKFIAIIAAAAAMLTSCWQEPEYAADYERHIISNLTQTPGDEEVTLAWEMAEGFSPVEYQVSYNDENGNTVQLRTGSNACTYVVEDLKNNVTYVFSVQAVYKGDALSGIVKVTSTPVTSRFPVNGFTLTPGDRKIDASWTLPEGNVTSMTIVLTPSDGSAPVEVSLDKAATSYSFTSLNNFMEYGVSLVVNYAKGPSDPVSGNATPMSGAPLCSVLYDNVFYGQKNTFTFNSTDYPGATDISWTFPDGVVLTGETATHKIWGIGDVAINVKCKINNIDVNYNVYVTAREFMTSYSGWSDQGLKIKNNNFAFSPDRKTAYTITYNNNRVLVAISLETGEVKWQKDFGTSFNNGAWIAVNPATGDVIVSDNSYLYSIKDNGTSSSETWKSAVGTMTRGVGPAVNADASVIFAGNNSKQFMSFNAKTGAKLGQVALKANVSAIVVDGNTVLVTDQATPSNVYFFDVTDPANIKQTKTFTAEGTGMDIVSASVAPDKKTVYFSCKDYVHCLDLTSQAIIKSEKVGSSSLTDGTLVDKNGNVLVMYAADASNSNVRLYTAKLESKKWDWMPEGMSQHKNFFNYSSPSIDSDGNFILSDFTGNMWSLASDGTATKIFAGSSINTLQGCPGFCGNAVFCSYNVAPGLILAKCIKSERPEGCWSGPGGDPCCTKCIQWAFK